MMVIQMEKYVYFEWLTYMGVKLMYNLGVTHIAGDLSENLVVKRCQYLRKLAKYVCWKRIREGQVMAVTEGEIEGNC